MGCDHLLIHIITKSLNLLPLYISESTSSPVGAILGALFAVLGIVIIIIIVIIVLYYLR